MSKPEQEIEQYLENYHIDLNEYMEMVVDQMPKYKVKLIPPALTAAGMCVIGHLIPNFDNMFIQLFVFTLLFAPTSYMLNRSLQSILNWDYITTNKRKGKLNYKTIQKNSYKNMPYFLFNDLIMNILFIAITVFVWVIDPTIPTNIILGIGLFALFLIGEQTKLKTRFFFFTRDNLLNELKQKEEV